MFLRSDAITTYKNEEWLWPPAMVCKPCDSDEEGSTYNDDPMPVLAEGSEDEYPECKIVETQSACSSDDWDFMDTVFSL